MNRGIVASVLVTIGVLSMAAAQRAGLSPQALEAMKIEKVRDRLYVITGSDRSPAEAFSGGNTAVFVTDRGVVLVDTKLPGSGRAILDRVRTVTNKPVIMIINTHTHGDHSGGNPFFGAAVDVIAHENTKINMTRMDAFKRSGGKGLPTKTFKDRISIGTGRDRIDVYYFGRGHTNGDAWVVFPALRVMHTGDMFARKDAPTLDRANGGSGIDFARTIGKAAAAVTDVDTLIVGHGPLRTMPELQEYRRFMMDFVAATRDAMRAGKSVDDATASIDLSAKYKDYRKERYRGAVEAIYDELRQ
jgi:glyoxylase-like metal-dependent hydrolase (beta-lactamase superfamily II)